MLDPRGGPIPGAANWTSGYMPAAYQGTVLRSSGNPILNLASRSVRTREMQGERIDAINALNGLHIRSRKGYSELAARIASYDLAYQLQSTAPEALDISSESEKTREMYGLYDKNRITPSPSPRPTLGGNASSPGGSSSAACASCNSTPAAVTSSKTGTPTTASMKI